MQCTSRGLVLFLTVALLSYGQFIFEAAPVNAADIAAANIDIVQNWPQSTGSYGWGDKSSATVTVPQSTANFSVPDWNTGDYYPAVDGQRVNLNLGILLATIRNNGRDNGDDFGIRYGTVETTSLNTPWGGNAFLATSAAGNDNYTGDELNIDLAAAWFPFAGEWTGANVTGGTIRSSSADVTTANLTTPSTGVWNLTVPGVDTRSEGLVFANGGANLNNFASAGATADGSRFNIQLRDNASSNVENGAIGLLYLPYDSENVVMGRVSGTGGVYNQSGNFSVSREGVGTFRLSIAGQDPTTGMLLLTSDATSDAVDNIISYEADGTDFVIQSRDINSGQPATLQDVGNAPAFGFAFVPFDTPPTGPGTRNFDPATQVAAANIRVTEIAPGTAVGDNHVEVTEGTGYLTTPTFTRGNIALYQNGAPLDANGGVLLATVRDHLRDNSATAGKSDYGVADVYASGGVYSLATWTLDPRSGEQQTHNIDAAVAYFPNAMGFAAEAGVAVPGGSTTLSVSGSGDTRRSGVLLATAYGTASDDNAVAVQPLTNGSGWTVEVRDNSSGLEADWFNYVFLPYGTENLVAGQVDWYGYVQNKAGNFSLSREGTGLYRLSIPGETPGSGMLLLTPVKDNWSSDNTLCYKADGDDFLIQGIDLQGDNTHGPQDTDFNFAFIGFDTPLQNPQLRTINPDALAAGNIRVIQHDTGTGATSVSVFTEQSTSGLTVYNANKGTYWLGIDGEALDADAGVLISSVRENGRDNGDGAGSWFAQSVTARDGSTYLTNTYRVSAGLYATTEHNIDTAAVYFPFSGGWQAGHATNSVNGGPITTLVTSPGINLGTEFIDNGNGQFELRLPGVDALSDGLVFANHGKLEGNYAMAGPSADGSHFAIRVHDCGVNGAGTEQDPVAFAYIPYDTPGVVMGRVSHEGGLYNKSGDFTVRREGAGTFRVTIAGHDPTTGSLLVANDPFGNSSDNIVTYQADGSGWIVQSRDLNANPPGLEDNFGTGAFSFAFVPFDSPPTAPGGRLFDPTAQVAAANLLVIHHDAGTGAGSLHVEAADGTGHLTTPYWDRGDWQVYQNGRPLDTTGGVMLATVREDGRVNAGVNDGTGDSPAIGLANVRTWNGACAINATRAGNSYNDQELNVNVAVSYFPYAQGWLGGVASGNDGRSNGALVALSGSPGLSIGTNVIDSTSTTGMYDVILPNSGDTRRSGLLFVNAAEEENNIATVAPKTDGSGWNVQVRNNTQENENDDFAFVFMPYGTANMIGAEISESGTMDNSTGNLYAFRAGTGTYRLHVPGGSPSQGMLLLSPVANTGGNQDNFLTYEGDGDDFVIRGYDAGNAEPSLQDTRFWVSYVSFDNPPSDPQLRTVDLDAVAAANLSIVQNDTGNTSASVTVTTPEGTPGFYVRRADAGDFYLARDGEPLDLSQGILMGTVRNLGRDNGDGTVRYGTVESTILGNEPLLATAVAGTAGGELNIDLAAAWFPFSGCWAGAHVDDTGQMWAARRMDQSMLTQIDTGRYTFQIPGVNSQEDGMLFAIGGSNSDRVVAAAILDDHTGWELAVRGNNQDGGSYAQDDFSLLYISYAETRDLIGGLIDESGTVLSGAGLDAFHLNRNAVGEYILSIDGESPETGMLLLTTAKKWENGGIAEDNILAYEAYGDDFLIRSYDLPQISLQDTDFVFAFVSFNSPMLIPEPGSLTLLAVGLLVLGCLRRRRS